MKNGFFALVIAILLTACGGGGEATSQTSSNTNPVQQPVQSNATYNLKQIFTNYLQLSEARTFSLSGNAGGVAITGNGTTTFGSLQSSNFENKSGFSKTISTTANVVRSGAQERLNVVTTSHYDTNYNILGFSGDGYSVATSSNSLPTAAKANDSGVWSTLTIYNGPLKSFIEGSMTITYTVAAETSTTAILTLLYSNRDRFSAVLGSSAVRYRIYTDGRFTVLSEEVTTPTGGLLITYN